MEKHICQTAFILLFILLISVSYAEQLQSSQVETLLRIKLLLNSPPSMNSWNNGTDFCNIEPTSSLTVICYEDSITQLHVVGDVWAPRLNLNFSIDSFVTTLVKLPSLKVLILVSLGLWGPLPSKLMRLSSLEILNLTSNFFQGNIPSTMSSLEHLQTLILDSNNFTGQLPRCLLSDSKKRSVLFAENCLATGDEKQQPISFCKNEALAVGILPRPHKQKQVSGVILALSICGGAIGSIILVSATILVVKRFLATREARKTPPRFAAENSSTAYTSKFLKDARYITQAMKLGALGLPAYRTFSLEELEQATNNFDTSTFMGEGSHGQMYRGQLRDRSFVAIRCLKMRRNHGTQYFMPHIEMISKLRHQHLVSALGHCFEYYLDDSSVSRVFLVFEYVPNGTLRSWISERGLRRKLTWAQRIAAATGVAKGIQFLHTGIVPGLFSNHIKITDVLVDQNLIAKISSYNLPLLSDNMGKAHLQNFLGGSKEFNSARAKHQDESDIYDLGVLLLEVICGRPIDSRNELELVKDQLEGSIAADDSSRKSVVDPTLRNSCSSDSMKTMIEICCRCLLKDPAERPSIEDVLWNLQFAAQVQDGWRGDSQSSDGSPISPLQSSRLKLTIKQ